MHGVKFLGNLAWLILGGGLVIAVEYALGGLVLCATIVGLPFGLQCLKLAGLGLWPFGKRVEADRVALGTGCLGAMMNVLWCLCAGVWIFLTHLALGLALAVTIVGLPFALQHLKFASLALAPFGKRVVEDG